MHVLSGPVLIQVYRLLPLPPTSPKLDDVRIRCLGLDDYENSGSIIALSTPKPVQDMHFCWPVTCHSYAVAIWLKFLAYVISVIVEAQS